MTAAQLRHRRFGLWAIIVVAASVVVFLPGAMNRWVFPKELVLSIGVVLASLAAPAGRLPRWMLVAIGVSSLVLLVAALAGATPLSQLLGRWPRYEGLVTLPVYAAALWAGSRLLGPAAMPAARRVFLRTIAVASSCLGVLAALESIGLRPIPSDLARPGSLLGNASDQGIVGLMFLALLVIPALKTTPHTFPRDTLLLRIGLGSALVSVVLSASRSAIAVLVALVVVVGTSWVLSRRRGERLRTALIGAGALLAVLVAVFAIPLTRARLTGSASLAETGFGDRVTIWSEAAALAVNHLGWGVGASGYLDAITPVHGETWFAQVSANTTIDSPHNILLQAVLAGGIPLLLLTLVIAAAVLVVGFRRWRTTVATGDSTGEADLIAGSLLALAAFGLSLMTHFTAPGTTILAALLIGIVVSTPPGTPARAARPVSVVTGLRRGRLAALVAWVVFLALCTTAELSLQRGIELASSADVAGADAAFSTARALRPWDGEVASIAAQSFAAAAESGIEGGQFAAVQWATTALETLPSSVLAAKALAVGAQYSGDFDTAIAVLSPLADRVPTDPQVAHRLGGMLALTGDLAGAQRELERAALLDPDNTDVQLTLEYVLEQIALAGQ